MPEIIIYHNGACSKSKGVLEILQEKNIPHTVRWYLSDPLSKKEIIALLEKLSLKASDIVRRKELLYKEQFEGKNISEEEWINILVRHPELIERPIVEQGDKAIIARPPETLLAFL